MIYGAAAVKAACNAKLAELFPDLPIYGNTVQDGYTRPGLFTSLLATAYDRSGKYQKEYGYSFIIVLLEETHDEAYCMDIADRIRDNFGMAVRLDNGHRIVVDNIAFEWIDEKSDVLQVTVDFYPVREISGQTAEGETAGSAEVNYKVLE